jgi:hypothetical protein
MQPLECGEEGVEKVRNTE